nr:ASN_HP1_G0046720.mRNA.1.CDS.1 [Saccharomyces cerevisiae]
MIVGQRFVVVSVCWCHGGIYVYQGNWVSNRFQEPMSKTRGVESQYSKYMRSGEHGQTREGEEVWKDIAVYLSETIR